MKTRSLRARLAFWQAGLLALTLISLAGLTYLFLREMLQSRADAAEGVQSFIERRTATFTGR